MARLPDRPRRSRPRTSRSALLRAGERGSLSVEESRRLLDLAVPEKDLQASVKRLAKANGWLFYHTLDSLGSDEGFPDCVMVNAAAGRIVFAELKREDEDLRPAQERWMRALLAVMNRIGVDAPLEWHSWKPSHWRSGEIARVLQRSGSGGGSKS